MIWDLDAFGSLLIAALFVWLITIIIAGVLAIFLKNKILNKIVPLEKDKLIVKIIYYIVFISVVAKIVQFIIYFFFPSLAENLAKMI